MRTTQNFRGVTPRSYQMGGLVLRSWLFIALMATVQWSFGQDTRLETDKGMATAVASQNADIRQAILRTSQYPQVLTQIQQMKDKTQASFQALISSFSEKKQGWFYEITRYPALMNTLANKPDGMKRSELDQLLPNNGDDNLEKAAWKIYNNHKDDLIEANNLNQQANQGFDKTIAGLDNDTQQAFKTIEKYPDLMSLLITNIDLTTNLGKLYVADKEGFMQKLAAQHDSLAIQNDQATAAFKKQLDTDPQARQELNQAAKDYAQKNGYVLPNGQIASNNYYSNPYSYWFGYPYWYGSPLWYPGAYWGTFGMGYGFGFGGLYGFPTIGYSNWFFGGNYYLNYPHLYRVYGNYYRNNLWGTRTAFVNRDFMQVAHNHFNPAATTFQGNRGGNYNANVAARMANGTVNNTTRAYNNSNFGGATRSYGGFTGARSFGGGFGGRHR